MIKQSIDKEILTILNNYVLNHRALKYMKQKLIELGERDKSAIIIITKIFGFYKRKFYLKFFKIKLYKTIFLTK